MTTYTVYVAKPKANGNAFAAPVATGLTIDDSTYQADPPIVGSNTTWATPLLFVQSFLRDMQHAFEENGISTRRGLRYSASSDGGTTFISARDS